MHVEIIERHPESTICGTSVRWVRAGECSERPSAHRYSAACDILVQLRHYLQNKVGRLLLQDTHMTINHTCAHANTAAVLPQPTGPDRISALSLEGGGGINPPSKESQLSLESLTMKLSSSLASQGDLRLPGHFPCCTVSAPPLVPPPLPVSEAGLAPCCCSASAVIWSRHRVSQARSSAAGAAFPQSCVHRWARHGRQVWSSSH
jgi:hypothetical protein